jgi:high-affinity iron transporter
VIAAILIAFREVVEAGLIVGVVLAATEGIAHRRRWIVLGVAAGVVGAAVLASFAGALSTVFSGHERTLFNAGVLIVAVVMLAWHQIWMARHGRQTAARLSAVGRAVAAGDRTLAGMALVVAIAVLREGSEAVLFLYGVAASGAIPLPALLIGSAIGIAAGAGLAWLLYRGLVAIPLRTMFRVTSWLIALVAAGMAGEAAAILAGARLIPAWGNGLWDTSTLLSEESLTGKALHALIGYSDRPMGVQLAAWAAVLLVLMLASRALSGTTRPSRAG